MLEVEGPITMDNAADRLAALTRAIDAGESEFALARLARSDSSAVAVLISALRHAGAAGKPLRLIGAPDTVKSLAKLYGVEALVR